MPRGSNAKREREYSKLKGRFKKEGRYKGREEQVAARIVNKQRAEQGETKEEKRKDREGKSPDRGLPIANYQQLTVREVRSKMRHLSKSQISKIASYERKHKNRKGLLETFDKEK